MRMMSRGEEARLWFKEQLMHRDEDEENNGTKKTGGKRRKCDTKRGEKARMQRERERKKRSRL